MLDISTDVTTKAVTMTDMVAVTANLGAGLYAIPLDNDGTDIGDYFIVASNSDADPTVLTMERTPTGDEVGFWLITNLLPTGWTRHAT